LIYGPLGYGPSTLPLRHSAIHEDVKNIGTANKNIGTANKNIGTANKNINTANKNIGKTTLLTLFVYKNPMVFDTLACNTNHYHV
jgi:hypothetical protein